MNTNPMDVLHKCKSADGQWAGLKTTVVET
jgi:hypothetical protein